MTAETETDWPYDADRNDPLTALRIPVVSSPHPEWKYIIAVDSGRMDSEILGKTRHRPTDQETRQLVSYLEEYIAYWFGDNWWRRKMLERPFDIDGGAVGVVFRKWGPDDWGYRRCTWEQGPVYVPQSPSLRERFKPKVGPLTLVQVMDRTHLGIGGGPSKRWVEWKSAHPDVFGEPT